MSDSLEPNVSVPASNDNLTRDPDAAKQRREPRPKFPEWAPWAILGGLIVVGAVGSSAVRAAVASSASAKPATAEVPSHQGPSPEAKAAFSARAQVPGENDARISVLHLVVTHADSVMGKSLKITRTREEAKARASEALARARKGEDFSKLITEFSEEPHTDETHGELKNFRRADGIPSFADAAFKLKVGELSEPVDTPFGYMVILRTK